MRAGPPEARIVVVTRKTPLQWLVERHGTMGQVQFYLTSRNEDIAYYMAMHERVEESLARVHAALDPAQRRTRVDREQLDRFLFAPDDVVVIVGQDGLVANVAKYLTGQLVIGINPDPHHYDGILCPHAPDSLPELLRWLRKATGPPFRVQHRAMAVAEREDGQRLHAINEVFVGHRTHQSARYRLCVGKMTERQSSSGLICATGTGGTGWARSIAQQRRLQTGLPHPEERRLAWFVREPFPSVSTGVRLDFGLLEPDQELVIVSEMGDNGVVFADGIESDRIEFLGGQRIRVRVADSALELVVSAAAPGPKHPVMGREIARRVTQRRPPSPRRKEPIV